MKRKTATIRASPLWSLGMSPPPEEVRKRHLKSRMSRSLPIQEMREWHLKRCRIRTSRSAGTALQEMPAPHFKKCRMRTPVR